MIFSDIQVYAYICRTEILRGCIILLVLHELTDICVLTSAKKMDTKRQRAVYEKVNILDDQVYEWVRFFEGQVYEWGRF